MSKFSQETIQTIANNTRQMNNAFECLTRILITDVSYAMLMSTNLKKADKNIHKTEIAIQKQTDDNKALAKVFNKNKPTTKELNTFPKFETNINQRITQIKSTFTLFSTLEPPEVNLVSKQEVLKDADHLITEIETCANLIIKKINNTTK